MSEPSLQDVLNAINQMEERINMRIDQIDRREFEKQIDNQFCQLEERLNKQFNQKFERLEEKMTSGFKLEQTVRELQNDREEIEFIYDQLHKQNKQIWKTQKLYKELAKEVKSLKASNS